MEISETPSDSPGTCHWHVTGMSHVGCFIKTYLYIIPVLRLSTIFPCMIKQ